MGTFWLATKASNQFSSNKNQLKRKANMQNRIQEQRLKREFISLVQDILHSEEFKKMKKYKHHVNGNLYEHSLKVAYLCFKHHRRFGLKIDIADFVRGALLHDYYLYDLHGDDVKHRFHWFKHPKKALERATEKYPTLTREQIDMIKHHMFPLTLIPPKTKAGWLVCFYDKVAAISDRFNKKK
jgi:uncharacterized protein